MITMCPHGYHHSGSMATPALGTRDVYMARASIRRAMTHRQFKWLPFCSINSYAHINTSKAVNN